MATKTVSILSVYNNEALPGRGLTGHHGNSFLIRGEDRQILFDVGWKGEIFLANAKALGIDLERIDRLIISHGHMDHVGGLPLFLGARIAGTPIPVIAHPASLEPKSYKILWFHFAMVPRLKEILQEKADLKLLRESTEIFPALHTSGEIAMEERTEKQGEEKRVFHKVDGKWMWDPVIDDLSLVLKARQGLVLITGCCHAGLLNACAKAKRLFGKKIFAIVGGTHMRNFMNEEVEHVGDVLEDEYGAPQLYLNHCTGRNVIEQLRKRFGPEAVRDCHVGTELLFEI